MDTRPCVVCGEGDECGTMQVCDGCNVPFHWNAMCARRVGIRRLTLEGDVMCGECRSKDTADATKNESVTR